MMHSFLSNNRDELIRRCKEKVARRSRRAATAEQLKNGIPMFLDQLTQTLESDEAGEGAASTRISGTSGGIAPMVSEMSVTAATHGKALLDLGFTVDQVVHDYGDLCQAVTDLAFERDAPFAVDEFRTLNRCLDNAIANAVSEFSFHRDAAQDKKRSLQANERIGLLVHELRNALHTGTLSIRAIELGSLPLAGATGAILKRSMSAMAALIDQAIGEVRDNGTTAQYAGTFALADLIAAAKASGELRSGAVGCTFTVGPVDLQLALHANYALVLAALENLLQNAFKFTHVGTEVKLNAYSAGARVLIDVSDHCGGLRVDVDKMFVPFFQQNNDKGGMGLGLAIARRVIEADEGELTVQDVPGVGSVFMIALPRHTLQ